jgi:septum formation protein
MTDRLRYLLIAMNYNKLRKLLEKYSLVLASGSPRRVRLLNDAGIAFRQLIPDIDESNSKHLKPYELATLLAEEKSQAALVQSNNNEVILGCDTIVVLNNRILGKPSSKEEAIRMLTDLAGNKHTVCSAVALLTRESEIISDYELTDVYFKKVAKQEIENYVDSGEPMDKAGAYGIQERGVFLVDRFAGNIDNVIGLPMSLLDELAGRLVEKLKIYG